MLFWAYIFLSVFCSALSANFRKYDTPVDGCGEAVSSSNNTDMSELACAYMCQQESSCVSMLHYMGRCTECSKSCKDLESGSGTTWTCWDSGREERIVVPSLFPPHTSVFNPVDCYDLRVLMTEDGVLTVRIEGRMPKTVFCTADGYTVFLHRSVGDVSFNRTMQEYVDGFGDAGGDHWLGLENIHKMTYGTNSELRIRSCCKDDQAGVEIWTDFEVGPGDNYTLHIGHLKNTSFEVPFVRSNKYLNHTDGAPFTTRDVDRDMDPNTPCSEFFGYGGWWYKGAVCAGINPTGQHTKDDRDVGRHMFNYIFNSAWSLREMTLMFRRNE